MTQEAIDVDVSTLREQQRALAGAADDDELPGRVAFCQGRDVAAPATRFRAEDGATPSCGGRCAEGGRERP